MEKDDVVVEEQLVNQDSSEAETSLEANSSNCRQDKVPETDCVLPQSASTLRSSAANAAPSICGLKNMPPNRPILGSRPPIAAGETIPSSLIRYKQRVIDVAEFFRDRTGVVFGVPGAFSPVCTELHVSGFKDHLSEFHSRGINLIVCITVNDPFVVKAWSESLQLSGEVVFLCDSTGGLTKKLGLLEDFSSTGMGLRCRRCALIIGPGSKVRWIGFEADAFAPAVLHQLDKLPEQPEQSTVGRSALRGEETTEKSHGIIQEGDEQSPKDEINSFFDSTPITPSHADVSPSSYSVCVSSYDEFEALEREIRGSSQEDRGTVVPYEIERSQCNLLGSYGSETDSGSCCPDDASDFTTDEDGFDDLEDTYKIDQSRCQGIVLHSVGIQSGDESLDIKFGYSVPDRSRFIRIKAPENSPRDILWRLSIEPRRHSAGYILVNGIKFFARNIHFHSPSLHLLHGTEEARPVEMHVVHLPQSNGHPVTQVVILALTFVCELEYECQPSKFVQNIIRTVLEKTFRSDGTPNVVDFSEAEFDLQKLIARNTMAAFYRYTTATTGPYNPTCANSTSFDEKSAHGSISFDQDTVRIRSFPTKSIETTWIVARDAIPLSYECLQSLRLVLGHDSIKDPGLDVNRLFKKFPTGLVSRNDGLEDKLSDDPSKADQQLRLFSPYPMLLFNSPVRRSSTTASPPRHSPRNTSNTTVATTRTLDTQVTLIVSSMLH